MGEVKFKGKSVKTVGELPAVGTIAPDSMLTDGKLQEIPLSSIEGLKLLNVFVSLDTPTCALSVKEFYKKLQNIKGITLLNISADLPFAQGRFCKIEGLDQAMTLSTFRSSFPEDYGLAIASGAMKGLCSRAVIVLDEEMRVLYTEQVEEISEEPTYEHALEAVQAQKR